MCLYCTWDANHIFGMKTPVTKSDTKVIGSNALKLTVESTGLTDKGLNWVQIQNLQGEQLTCGTILGFYI